MTDSSRPPACLISPYATKRGYARKVAVRFGKRVYFHHVLAWIDSNGRLPAPGRFILHSPMPGGHPRNCIELTHLREGTTQENMRDRVADGNHIWANRTHCPRGHPYDEANTRYYRGGRHCRSCSRERAAVRRGPPQPRKTHCPAGHEYNEVNCYTDTLGKRHCRPCDAARHRARAAGLLAGR